MTSEDVQTNLRLPAELKERVVKAAAQNKRSLSAEVAARLEESFTPTALSRLPALVEEYAAELMHKDGITKPDALEVMAARAQVGGHVVIIHYEPGLKLGDLRGVMSQMLDPAPADASVFIYPVNLAE